ERPGHPVLNVASKYLPDTKQVRLEVKQTQPGEAFRFPLPVLIKTVSATMPPLSPPAKVGELEVHQGIDLIVTEIAETAEVTDKDQIFFFNVAKRPEMIVVDPDLTVF